MFFFIWAHFIGAFEYFSNSGAFLIPSCKSTQQLKKCFLLLQYFYLNFTISENLIVFSLLFCLVLGHLGRGFKDFDFLYYIYII